jgi:hypothetical protein
MLTTHPLLVPRSRNERGYTSSPPLHQNWHVMGNLYLLPSFIRLIKSMRMRELGNVALKTVESVLTFCSGNLSERDDRKLVG